MNKKLISELTKMDDVTFLVLEHHFNVARMIRDCMIRNGLSNNDMAGILGIAPKKMKSVLNAAYPFDLMLLSKLQAYNESTAANNAKFKIQAETIGFSKYKEKYPMYVDRINKLLTILEKQNPAPGTPIVPAQQG